MFLNSQNMGIILPLNCEGVCLMHQTFCRGRKLDRKHGGQLGN